MLFRSHAAPTRRDVHHRVFGEKVEFNHEFNGLMCSRADLKQPNPSADPVMARYAQELVHSKAVGAPSFTHQIQQLILMLMPLGQCRADVLAAHLGCDRRTITRRLQAEQTCFHQLVNTHRRHMVAEYLRERSRPLSQIGRAHV